MWREPCSIGIMWLLPCVRLMWMRWKARQGVAAMHRRRALYADPKSTSRTALLPCVSAACFSAPLAGVFVVAEGLQFADRGGRSAPFEPKLNVVAVGQTGGCIAITVQHSNLPEWCPSDPDSIIHDALVAILSRTVRRRVARAVFHTLQTDTTAAGRVSSSVTCDSIMADIRVEWIPTAL